MKLLYVITLPEHGGAQSHVLSLLKAMRNRAELALCVGRHGYLTEAAGTLGVPFYVVPELVRSIRPLSDARATHLLIKLIRDLRPDLLHAHTAKAGVVGRIAAAWCGIPSVFTPHGWTFSPRSSRVMRSVALCVERMASRWTDRIIAVCDAERQLALECGIAPQRLTRIHHGIEDAEQRADPGRGGEMIITMIARFAPPKEQDTLLDAMAGTDVAAKLVFVGDGPTRGAVERKAASLPGRNSVAFLGTRCDVPQILAGSHILVLTSASEALPVSVLEAMRAGVPVIANDVGGVRELVVDGVTGFLVPRGDTAALRKCITILAGSGSLRRMMGAAGRQRYQTCFALSEMVARTEAVYREVLDRRAPHCAGGRGHRALIRLTCSELE